MLTSFADAEALNASVLAGARGYVLKNVRGDGLVHAHSPRWPTDRCCSPTTR